MSKEGRLTRVGVLAPAALSACMDASVLAVPAASAIVSTVLKELSKAFMLKKWFHGSISAKEAEELMMEQGKHGSFLVRESRGRPGDYVLTVRVKRRVSHVVIRKQNDKYDIGTGEEFEDLIGLIEHFRKFPIVETSGEMLRLLQPLGGLCRRRNDSNDSGDEAKRMEEARIEKKKDEWNKDYLFVRLFDNMKQFTNAEAFKAENMLKNRYRNVWPYDQTRVILKERYEEEGDYINASYIKSAHMFCTSLKSSESLSSVRSLPEHSEKASPPLRASKSVAEGMMFDPKHFMGFDKNDGNQFPVDKEKVYIATQGCLPTTKNDFWRMITQEDVRIIVMVAKEIEGGKSKCAKYWPNKNKKEWFDGIKVVCSSEKIHEEYLVRELEVYDVNNVCRTVYQYQYFAWPDHGAPGRAASILSFIEDINECNDSIMHSKSCPEQNNICVHCSAGVGRTGTFIALDMLMDKIKITGLKTNIDVCETVKLCRCQRQGMVQTSEQYQFINFAVEEFINNFGKKQSKRNNLLCCKN